MNNLSFPEILFGFTFLYPLLMAYVWMAGGIFYWLHYERKAPLPSDPPELPSHPKIALIVPCFNEEDNVYDTVTNLLNHDYPNFEVIAINDGSKDKTGEILDAMCKVAPRLRVIHQNENQGKAVALNTAALLTTAEYLVCIDGDALLDPKAARWMLWHLLKFPRVGAVTGNPRIRNRSSLLGKVQVGEFSSIIGLIKRAQRTYGRLFTVSGVAAAFRKSALHEVGYWSKDMMCEDIDISWKLQTQHWDVRFEPAALCWILMPETFTGLWKQRLRWAIGGAQVIMKYFSQLGSWKQRRMWFIYAEYLTSVVWAYSFLISTLVWITGFFVTLPSDWQMGGFLPEWPGLMIATTSLLQVGVGMFIDSRYDTKFVRQYFWIIWYPAVFWLITFLTAIVALPRAIFRTKGKRAVWVSPDRGIV